jgi:tetratricopeptide (TPR) repeat protein
MRCPSCDLYHPSTYDHCVSCGTRLASDHPETVRIPGRSVRQRDYGRRLSSPVGIAIAVAIVIISAAITLFLLRPSNESVLYDKAQKELSSGRYAFAVKELEQLASRSPNDPKVFLALARAYVGVDQIDRAWACISHAQQLGAGVVADPALTYQLANYYRQQGNYERAAQLLRPLASANIADASAQLSDLDASWGDSQIDSNIEQALRCWEEVRSLNTGSRVAEAPGRLATIYQRYADKLIASGDDKAALAVLEKLNGVAQNPAYHEMTADVYDRLGLYDKACDQLRTAISLAGPQSNLNTKLASLLIKYGKQLMDSGDTQRGSDCFQQASDLDKTIAMPSLVLKDVSVDVNPTDRHAQMSASVFNAGQGPANHVRVEAQLISTATSRVFWQGTESVVGEYETPLMPHSSKSVEFNSTVAVRSDGAFTFNVLINGQLYKSYPIGRKPEIDHADTQLNPQAGAASIPAASYPEGRPSILPSVNRQSPKSVTPEDQTLKDLER